MPRHPLRSLAFALAFTALSLLPGAEAWAGSFEVGPVRLDLAPGATSGLLTIHNQSTEALRFQVSAFTWSQGRNGEPQLTPTQDIVFFPAMISIAPGGSRKIRVGTSAPFQASEQTYRVFVEELPPSSAAQPTNTIRVLTRMGIPVFLTPAGVKATPQIQGVSLAAGKLRFAVADLGTAHFMSRLVRVIGRDARGQALFERRLPAWYVLAGGARDYELDIPKDICGKLAGLTVDLETEHANAQATIATAIAQCSR